MKCDRLVDVILTFLYGESSERETYQRLLSVEAISAAMLAIAGVVDGVSPVHEM